MKKINVTIEGVTPLLMNRFDVAHYIAQGKTRSVTKIYDPKEEAERSAYWGTGKKKTLIIPNEVIYASILNASSFHKIGKRSAKSIIAGAIRIEPMEISLGTDKYVIDSRPVVIARARVVKSRAKLMEWKATFTIVYNEAQIGEPTILKDILSEAGERVGVMDFRPQRAGNFGCFRVTSFKAE